MPQKPNNKKKNRKVDVSSLDENDIYHLNGLREHPGWEIIIKITEENIKFLSGEILDNIDNYTDEQIRLMTKLREWQRTFIRLPEQLATATSAESQETDFDPYFKSYKDIKDHEKGGNQEQES